MALVLKTNDGQGFDTFTLSFPRIGIKALLIALMTLLSVVIFVVIFFPALIAGILIVFFDVDPLVCLVATVINILWFWYLS